MSKRNALGAMGIAVALMGCGAGAAAESATPEPMASATPTTADVCLGRNGQDLNVPMPADGWGRAWNETGDDDSRAALLRETFAPDGTYGAPELDARVSGLDAVDEHIDAFQTGRPGEYFEWIDWQPWYLHHDRIFMPWRLCSPSGEVLLEGFDVGVIGPDGLLIEATSFNPPE